MNYLNLDYKDLSEDDSTIKKWINTNNNYIYITYNN